MIGAFTHNKTQTTMFAFNTTYDVHSNGTRVGLVVTFPLEVTDQNMYEMSISTNLSVLLEDGFSTQTLTFIPYNDFEVKSFDITITGNSESTVLTILIIILAVGVTVGFIIYIVILIKRKKQQP